tara:strand:- start:18803 stop:19399 length:597 start_codon:yes stop_codon:yes gene_type:complete
MEGKKTFIFYSDWINMVREMPNEEAGLLLKHVLSYVNDENPISENVLVKMAFAHMKPILKSDLEKWDDIREKRKEYGAKGGKANAKQKLPKAKQVEAVNDNVNDNVISIINTESHNDIFRKLWYSDQWIESLCMKWKCEKNDFLNHLNGFRIDCISKEELKVNEKDAKSHFVNWVNKGNTVPYQEKKYSKSAIKDNWW